MEEFMLILVVIPLIILIILVASLKGNLQNQIIVLQQKIDDLATELRKSRVRDEAGLGRPAETIVKETPRPAPPVVERPAALPTPTIIPQPVPPPVPALEKKEEPKSVQPEPIPAPVSAAPVEKPIAVPPPRPPVVRPNRRSQASSSAIPISKSL
jgi:outer membrane biosynthesis protein TonB